MPQTITITPEIREAILERGAEDAFKCYQCGTCMGACPWYQVENVDFLTYRIPQAVKLGTILSNEDKDQTAAEVEEIFRCVGCEACVRHCPRGVDLPDIFRAIRRILVEYESIPQELKSVISKVSSTGNPLGAPREKRADWAEGLDVSRFESSMEFLYFPCCIQAYDGRGKEIARKISRIFNSAGVSFGIPGDEVVCCCESIRLAGAERIFQKSLVTNITALKEAGVKKVVTTSPHCYSIFRQTYAELHAGLEVIDYSQLFIRLIEEKRLVPRIPLDKRVVYHDSCCLGLKNRIFDEPRRVLKSIPGLELVEIEAFTREFSLCCAGGGGGLWLDRPVEERITHVRLKQVSDTGAEILTVACPYCLIMFEEGIKVMNLPIEVKDISELLFSSLQDTQRRSPPQECDLAGLPNS
ncbi:MAG: (Fe-S)-binding protein [bacterium]